MYKIYRIVDNTNGNIYIGKTKQTLKERLYGHKNKTTCSSREIIKNGDYKIELIEETQDESREIYWIQNTNCINANKYNYDKKEAHKIYYKNNKDYIDDYKKKYNKRNTDRIKNYHRELRQYTNSWGGETRSNNNLLKIDINLFL